MTKQINDLYEQVEQAHTEKETFSSLREHELRAIPKRVEVLLQPLLLYVMVSALDSGSSGPIFLIFLFNVSFQLANQNARTVGGAVVKLHTRVLTIDISASHSSPNLIC